MLFEIIGALFVSLILVTFAVCVLLVLILAISFLMDTLIDEIICLTQKFRSLKKRG